MAELTTALKSSDKNPLYLQPDQAISRLRKKATLFLPLLKEKHSITASMIKKIESFTAQSITSGTVRRKTPSSSNLLHEYKQKRNFAVSSEPEGEIKDRNSRPIFVIQKHQASHLHFDFRLEMDGVLKSWAVPKGPPLSSQEKRLAMQVEDHPIEYADFEGIIPKGEYGGGTVMVWDYGTYQAVHDNAQKGYSKGELKIKLSGKKLSGTWMLIRSKEDKRWLMIMEKDAKVIVSKKQLELSALTERTLSQITDNKKNVWRNGRNENNKLTPKEKAQVELQPQLKRQKPKFVEPMLASLVPELPEGDGWIYEIKLDGYRTLIIRDGKIYHLASRQDNSFNKRFPSILQDAKTVNENQFVIDGEIVAVDDKGRPDFQALQNYHSPSNTKLLFYAFDVLNVAGQSVMEFPFSERRILLEKLIKGSDILFSKALRGEPRGLMEQTSKAGLEGIVAKQIDSTYLPGERGGTWLKCKTINQQELVIGGMTKAGSGTFDALVLGYYQGDNLLFAGKIRAGFTPRTRREVYKKLKSQISENCPFSDLPQSKTGKWGNGLTKEKMKECIWLKPKKICVIKFAEWTDAHHIRHGSFISFRDDKPAKKVTRKS